MSAATLLDLNLVKLILINMPGGKVRLCLVWSLTRSSSIGHDLGPYKCRTVCVIFCRPPIVMQIPLLKLCTQMCQFLCEKIGQELDSRTLLPKNRTPPQKFKLRLEMCRKPAPRLPLYFFEGELLLLLLLLPLLNGRRPSWADLLWCLQQAASIWSLPFKFHS